MQRSGGRGVQMRPLEERRVSRLAGCGGVVVEWGGWGNGWSGLLKEREYAPALVKKGGGVPGVPYHEGHLFCGDLFGRDDEVAFVFAFGGVKDDDEIAIAWLKSGFSIVSPGRCVKRVLGGHCIV